MTTVPSMVSQQLGLLSSGADPADVRAGQSFIKPGSLAIQAGTMTDNGDLGTIVPGTTDVPIPEGYTTGGVVQGDADLVSSNIKAGTDIFGVTGTAVLASGNAVNANVLAGVTYSSSSGFGTGTMPNNGSLGIIIPDTTTKTIPAGYTTGGSVAGSINLIPSNIRSGTSIYGVTGSVIQASGSATADKLLLGETASTAAGVITGTMPNNGSLGTITPGVTNKPIPLGYTSGGSVAGSGNLQAGNIRLGVNIFGITGSLDPGTQTGGTANPEDVLSGETFTNDSGVQTGSMVNNGAVNITPSNTSQPIPLGYHNGGGQVNPVSFDTSKVLTGTTIAGTAGTMTDNGNLGTITPGIDTQAIPAGYTSGGTVAGDLDLISGNIKSGVTIFGVDGTLETSVINGQVQQSVIYDETISANDPISITSALVNDTTVNTYPTGSGRSVSWSPDNIYLAVSHSTTPFVTIYKRNGKAFTKLSDPAVLPPGNSVSASFSNNGNYLAVGSSASTPYLTIYKRSGDVFTKLTDPAVLPTGTVWSVAWSADDIYLAVAQDVSPFISIYKRDGDTFTKLANPSTLPTGSSRSVSWSNDGVYLAVVHTTSPFMTIYKRSGDVFTKLTNPATLPTGNGASITWNYNGSYLVFGGGASPYLTIYKRAGDVLTKLTDPAVQPASAVTSVVFKPSNPGLLYVAATTSPLLIPYSQNGDVFTKYTDPATMPPAYSLGMSFSNDGVFLALGLAANNFLYIYSGENHARKSSNKMTDLINKDGAGYALASGIAGDTKDAIMIWR